MAQMIPPRVNEKAPPGERLLFDKFKNDPATENWIVLHSLGVAKHPERTEGELDFVVMVPEEGILFLEVKSGRVSRESGLWKYGTGPFAKTSLVGPFRQASEAMHAIRSDLAKKSSEYRSLLYFSAAVFTLIDFDEVSPEWHSWQVIDKSKLTRTPISRCCLHIFQQARKHLENVPSAKWYNNRRSRPSLSQVKEMARLMRGDFEYVEDPRLGIESSEKNIIRFTEEQYLALDVLEENSRVVFKGPAGSGKTFLAIEAVRRSVGKEDRVLFACYNRLLGHWLENEVCAFMGASTEAVKVGSLHKVMLQLSGLKVPENNDTNFWIKTLPETVLMRGLEGEIKVPQFDFIVLDEAQDLINDEYLDVLDILLKGGLTGGRWTFFGDYEKQAIYSNEKDKKTGLLEILEKRSPAFFRFPLRTNCRNVAPIAIGIESICGLNPGYSKILRDEEDEALEVYFYKDNDEQQAILKNILYELRETYTSSEIVVLSSKEDSSSACGRYSRDNEGHFLAAYGKPDGSSTSIKYMTIHSFKGLEAPVIVVTDITKVRGDKAISLLYVGMSRARTKLVLLISERSRDDYLAQVQSGLFLRKSKEGQS